MAETITRFVGNCQICERDHKVNEGGKVVLHGYLRPGDGQAHGRCPGEGYVPYEVSCELIKLIKRSYEHGVVDLQKRLAALKDGKVTHLTRAEPNYRHGNIEVTHYVIGVTSVWTFQEAVKHAIWDVVNHIARDEQMIKQFAKRIREWEPKPVRTVEECKAIADQGRAERKAVRDAARAERAAKAAATRAKRDKLQAERDAIKLDFQTKFKAYAARNDRAAAEVLVKELCKAKYRWLWTVELDCNEELKRLGYLQRDENGRWVFTFHRN